MDHHQHRHLIVVIIIIIVITIMIITFLTVETSIHVCELGSDCLELGDVAMCVGKCLSDLLGNPKRMFKLRPLAKQSILEKHCVYIYICIYIYIL